MRYWLVNMADFVPKKEHLREVMLHYFLMKKSAAETARILGGVYGDHAPSEKICQRWFGRFRSGDFDVNDKERPGQPKKFEDADLEDLLAEDPRQSQGMRYRQQLINLNHALIEKRPQWARRHGRVILLHDNASSNTAKSTKETIKALEWEALPHPPYSPDLAPSDYHLFRSMAHGLADQHFANYEEVAKWLESWLASKGEKFYWEGIHNLPDRWSKCVESDGAYFE